MLALRNPPLDDDQCRAWGHAITTYCHREHPTFDAVRQVREVLLGGTSCATGYADVQEVMTYLFGADSRAGFFQEHVVRWNCQETRPTASMTCDIGFVRLIERGARSVADALGLPSLVYERRSSTSSILELRMLHAVNTPLLCIGSDGRDTPIEYGQSSNFQIRIGANTAEQMMALQRRIEVWLQTMNEDALPVTNDLYVTMNLKLVATINFFPKSKHYTAYVLRDGDRQWYYYDCSLYDGEMQQVDNPERSSVPASQYGVMFMYAPTLV